MSNNLRVVNLLACLALVSGGCVELEPGAEDIGTIEQMMYFEPTPGLSYHIRTFLPSPSCIDLPAPGIGAIVLNACAAVASQSLDVVDAGGGRVYLRQTSTGKCITMNSGSLGAKAWLANCANLATQQFSFAIDQHGGVFIQTALSPGYTLTVPGGSTANFTSLGLFYWTGDASQRWFVWPAFVSYHPLSNPSSCMDHADAAIRAWTCDRVGYQGFMMIPQPNGLVRLSARYDCVDIVGAGTANGTDVQLSECNESAGQLFQILRDGYGNVIFKNPNSGRCLDVTGGAQADGTPIRLQDCTGAANQKWSVR